MDDGVSGAEFAARPGFVRLMNALKPRPPFDVLVMSEESRLSREAIKTAYALKQLIQAARPAVAGAGQAGAADPASAARAPAGLPRANSIMA